jgi:two-component system, OmpR family, sensor kinase
VSALLTFVILLGFAIAVGSFTVHRIRSDFNRDVAASANDLAGLLQFSITGSYAEGFHVRVVSPNLDRFAASEHAVIRVMTLTPSPAGSVIASTKNAPDLGLASGVNYDGYRVETRHEALGGPIGGRIIVQYGRRLSDVEATVNRVRLLLLLGVLAGTALALLAGMAIARRAMTPIAQLTSTAEQIAHTRDPSQRVPQPEADDEVAELARTLEGMLRELDAARGEAESLLARQRQFVADASHELRTPLTSVLANLELLADALHGDQGDAARSALRSSKRMRRLVADLLLLARSDVGRVAPRERCDLAQVVVEAAGELGPVSARHDISLDVQPAVVHAVRDELHRLVINLLENALRHTPPGTSVRVCTVVDGAEAKLVVQDDGPGVPPQLATSLFERFVRGSGDRGGSFGLGLAIVRAVAESHGGSVVLETAGPQGGARFVVRLPLASDLDHDRQDHRPALEAVVD